MRSAGLTLPGFVHDVCAAVHPLTLASPVFRELELAVDWIHPPAPAAHPFEDAPAAVLERSLDETAAGLEDDGAAYRRLLAPLCAAWAEIQPVALGPYPPRAGPVVGLARRLGARSAAAPLADARSLAERELPHRAGRGFSSGHAAHSMLERRPSAGFGLALLLLGHVVGWPLPRGGSQRIADGLVAKLGQLGGRVHVEAPVDELPPADVILADVAPRELVRLAQERLPPRDERALHR